MSEYYDTLKVDSDHQRTIFELTDIDITIRIETQWTAWRYGEMGNIEGLRNIFPIGKTTFVITGDRCLHINPKLIQDHKMDFHTKIFPMYSKVFEKDFNIMISANHMNLGFDRIYYAENETVAHVYSDHEVRMTLDEEASIL